MATLERLGPEDLRAAVTAYRDALRAHQDMLNRLNVYPVPDGDTGTNMALTLEAVAAELGGCTDMASTCRAISHGSLMGARGNSGVILSQVLRGLTECFRELDGADGAALADALAAAAEAAYGAVLRPVEGTILTVAREAAEAARAAADAGKDLVGVLDAAHTGAREALARTPELLPVLKEAGVVDAGGAGLALLLDALLAVVAGREVPEPEPADVTGASPAAERRKATGGPRPMDGPRYEVMYFLEAPDEAVPGFKEAWGAIGDSIVVVGGDGMWNCHIHTDDVGAAIEAAVERGRPRQIRVTDLAGQVEEERWVRQAMGADAPAAEAPEPRAERVTTAVVAVGTGDGVHRILRSLGVQQVVTGGQTMNPSTAQLLEAVEAAPADQVVILPNNKNIVPVAEQVGGVTRKRIRVIRTRGVTEAFGALLAYDPVLALDENADAMAEAADRIVSAEVTRAVRDAPSEAGPIREGEWLGLSEGRIQVVDADLGDTCCALLDAVVGETSEVVTVVEGDDADPEVTARVTEWLEGNRPGIAIEVLRGGQPLYPYLFGIE